jgi:hypothetical protein
LFRVPNLRLQSYFRRFQSPKVEFLELKQYERKKCVGKRLKSRSGKQKDKENTKERERLMRERKAERCREIQIDKE